MGGELSIFEFLTSPSVFKPCVVYLCVEGCKQRRVTVCEAPARFSIRGTQRLFGGGLFCLRSVKSRGIVGRRRPFSASGRTG